MDIRPPPRSDRPVVEVRDLVKRFGAFTAVDGISFSVRRGECFGLLGPNGAGKTTTVRMLYGYAPPSGGCLNLFGEALPESLRAAKYRIGVCQQEDNLDPDLPVGENLLVFGRYFDLSRSESRKRAGELLRFFGLENRASSGVRILSGGMMRRLVLARSLINHPDLLILDEPTTGLDPQSRHQVWQRLEELKAKGLTILLTSHYMEEAERLCDRLIIIDDGRILVEGAPRDLVREHVGREVVEIAGAAAQIRPELERRGLPFEDLGGRLIVYTENGEELLVHLARDFGPQGLTLRRAGLEDVFLRLTGRELRE